MGKFLNGPGEQIGLNKGVGSGIEKDRWLFTINITMLESIGCGALGRVNMGYMEEEGDSKVNPRF